MKILFISHDASRTGAPRVLLGLLNWIKDNHPYIKIYCIALKGGETEDEFRKVSVSFNNLSAFTEQEDTFFDDLKKRVKKKIGLYRSRPHPREEFIKALVKENFDLIYANTVISIPLAYQIKEQLPQTKFIAHIHELSSIISLFLPDIKSYFPFIDSIIVPSDLTKKHLIKKFSCPSQKINKVYEFTSLEFKDQVKNKSEFTVGGVGTVHWRKGSDLFVQVAQQIFKKHPKLNIKFEWIGSISEKESIIIEADIEKAGLNNKVSFLGAKANPEQYYANFDIFLLPSREDPFPLVAIEMGMLGKPIICFENATGTEEVVKLGGGFILPYLDVEAMAEKIIVYYQNRRMIESDGNKAKELFSKYTPENICPLLFEEIKREVYG